MQSRTLRKFFSNINYQNLLFTILGSALVAFGTTVHIDSEAADGGLIGICRLIEFYTNGKIEVSVSALVLNAFCYILAWRLMNAKFIFNMAMGTVTYSLFVMLFDQFLHLHIPYVLLATLFGMLCIELGTGIMLRYGSSPNGEYVLTMSIVKKGDFNFGWLHFIKDFIIIVLFLPVFGLKAIIYSLLLMTTFMPMLDFIATSPKRSSVKHTISSRRKHWIPILITGFVLVIIFTIGIIYINDYYKADYITISNNQRETVEVLEPEKGFTAYAPDGEIKAGLVFYPGAKIEYISYAPLLEECAEQGILCVVVEMPCNLAFLGINRAMKAIELYPEIDTWYIGGHSLGGTMAASCASVHSDIFEGVVLLGSYSTANISSIPTVSIFGSQDKVLNLDKYQKNKSNLPEDYSEVVIEGGNHAYFGMYGEQRGDGDATITNLEQIKITASHIINFILNRD